jgi:copper(I)-binding protein
MSMEGAVMQMRPAGPLPIPARQSVTLAPNGLHLMFMGVTQPFAEGEEIPVRLSFEHAGAVDVSLPVRRQAPAADDMDDMH